MQFGGVSFADTSVRATKVVEAKGLSWLHHKAVLHGDHVERSRPHGRPGCRSAPLNAVRTARCAVVDLLLKLSSVPECGQPGLRMMLSWRTRRRV
jgi:hypothetical protein